MISAGSAIGTSMGVSAITQAWTSACGALQAGIGYAVKGDILAIQKQSAMNAIKHEDTMAYKTMEAQLGQLKQQEENIHTVQNMSAKGCEAKEELKKASDDERVVDAELAETKLTQKQGEINDKALRKDFYDYRGRYPSGNPTGTSSRRKNPKG